MSCLIGLLFQRSHLAFQLVKDICYTGKICLLVRKLFLGKSFSSFEFDDTYSFVKKISSFFGLTGKDLFYLTLSYDTVTILTDTGIIEQLVNVF